LDKLSYWINTKEVGSKTSKGTADLFGSLIDRENRVGLDKKFFESFPRARLDYLMEF
jgi:hypothetical protein